MASHQLTLPGQLVKKHNELVRSKINVVSVHGSRILASLISCIRADDVDFKKTYSISAKDLLPNSGGGNYAQIKDICLELIKTAVEIEMLDPNNEKVLVLFSFFSSIQYKKGIIEARFNQDMRGFLLELKKHFTQYNLMEYLVLSSIYSQRLFEVLKSWASLPEVTIELTELHKMLHAPESCKNNFGEFRRKALDKAHKEIQTKIGFYYEWEPIKKGRAVVAVRFVFTKKRALPVAKAKATEAQGKKSKRKNDDFKEAAKCWKSKDKQCKIEDNKETVCHWCKEFHQN